MIKYNVRSRALIDVLNDLLAGKIILSPHFQRKLVWRLAHKIDFIKTIILGYPFPEIFLARGKIDVESMTSTTFVVDGQQRLNSIKEFVAGDFEVDGEKFSGLSLKEREDVLKYEMAIIDLDLAHDDGQVIEIFKRLNRTFYALSNIEKQATEYAASEFMLTAKLLCGELQDDPPTKNVDPQLPSQDPNLTDVFVQWGNSRNISDYLSFILSTELFTKQEIARQVHLAYTLNVMSTALAGYYNRNDAVKNHLNLYADAFDERDNLVEGINAAARFIKLLKLKQKTFWSTKSNSFSLLLVSYAHRPRFAKLDKVKLRLALDAFATQAPPDYALAAKEGVNNKQERSLRAEHIVRIFEACATGGS